MTADKIKAAALPLFARGGYEGTSLSDIAREVGIKKPSIYAHFKSKEDLFLAVFADVMWDQIRHSERLAREIKDYPVEKKLFAILKDSCAYYLQDEERTAFFKRTMLFPPDFLEEKLREKFLASEEAQSAILRAIFAEGMKQGIIRQEEMDHLLASYYCLMDGLFVQAFYYGRENFAARLESVWKTFWLGVTVQSKDKK